MRRVPILLMLAVALCASPPAEARKRDIPGAVFDTVTAPLRIIAGAISGRRHARARHHRFFAFARQYRLAEHSRTRAAAIAPGLITPTPDLPQQAPQAAPETAPPAPIQTATTGAEYAKSRAQMGPRQALIMDQWMAPVEILLGKRELAEQTARWWKRESAYRYTDPYILAAYYAELGWNEQSFDSLFKGLENRSPSMIYLRWDKNFPPSMRSDSRFHTLLQKLNLPENGTVEH